MNNEVIKQRLDGTDDLSLARGLAIGFIETLSGAVHELSYLLFEGLATRDEILEAIKDNVSFVRHNSSIIHGFASDFDTLCENVRAGHE